MTIIKKLNRYLFNVGYIKTIWFNFRYLPFYQAIHIPVLLDRKVQVKNCHSGSIILEDASSFGSVKIGFLDTDWCYRKPSLLNIHGKVVFYGRNHNFAPGLILYVGKNATIEFGDMFSVSHDTKIHCIKSIKIGYNNMWSYRNVIMDTDGHPIYNEKEEIINPNKGVEFGENIWMGCNTTILKGAIIPSNTIIASGSVISKHVEGGNHIISNQGKIIRQNVHWKREFMEQI